MKITQSQVSAWRVSLWFALASPFFGIMFGLLGVFLFARWKSPSWKRSSFQDLKAWKSGNGFGRDTVRTTQCSCSACRYLTREAVGRASSVRSASARTSGDENRISNHSNKRGPSVRWCLLVMRNQERESFTPVSRCTRLRVWTRCKNRAKIRNFGREQNRSHQ